MKSSRQTNKLHDQEHIHAPPPFIRGYAESYVKLSSSRTIFFNEEFSKKTSTELASLLLYYDHKDHQEITLYINSSGGDVAALINVYDVMQMIKSPVKTVLLGKAYSAGAVILAAGSPGRRFALASGKCMIHGVQFGFPCLGKDYTDSKDYLEFIKNNNDIIMKILAKHTGKSLDQVKLDCVGDKWMNAQQAVSYGIIDGIL